MSLSTIVISGGVSLGNAPSIGEFSLSHLTDVSIDQLITGQYLRYDSVDAVWKNITLTSVAGEIVLSGTISTTTIGLADTGVAGTYTKVTTDAKGRVTAGTTLVAGDIPSLDASTITTGIIDAARLPSSADDVLEYTNLAGFPVTGETGKIYVALDTNKLYRYSGTAYVYITSGAVDSVAGKTGVVTLVKADVGLSSVDNTSDATKDAAISTLTNKTLVNPLVTSTSGTALTITNTGTGNSLVIEDSASPDSTPVVVTADGQLIIGSTTGVPGIGQLESLQIIGTGNFISSFGIYADSATTTANMRQYRKRPENAAVIDGDGLGANTWFGWDGSAHRASAQINIAVQGVVATNSVPSRLSFSTTPVGGTGVIERVRINNDGKMAVYSGLLGPNDTQQHTLPAVASDTFALLNATQTLTNKTLTSPLGIVKADVGLGSVDNTADAAKPVSTAQQTALNLKANIASPVFTGNVTGLGISTGTSFNAITGLASIAPLADNTAAVGTSTLAARQDHVHPVQTTVSGNATTATRLAADRTINGVIFNGLDNITINAVDSTTRIATTEKGAVNGVATLDASGLIPSTQLPSYVDDVLEFANLASFPVIGETAKIYVALDTNKTYRWSGSAYVYITSGAVDSVAGKTGVVALVKADVGLGSVDNTADAAKPVSTAQQTALDLKANLASPVFTGNVTGLGISTGTSFNALTGLALVAPLVAETAAVGTSTLAARQDHVHPAQTAVSGNAGTATRLTADRTINGVIFNGLASITIEDATKLPLAGGTLTGALIGTTITASSFNATSTQRVKQAITDLNVSYLDRFDQLKPREYDRTDYAAHEFGFIAEEMAQVYPEVVGRDDAGQPSGIDYGKLSTILTAKVQEQQTVIQKLQSQMAEIMLLVKGLI